MTFRFLHLADTHLETRFGGRSKTRGRLRRAVREAFERAVDLALDERLHAVLVAGDLYDDPVLSLGTETFLLAQVRRLSDAGVWFLSVCGNHDPGAPSRRAAGLGLDGSRPPAWAERVVLFRHAKPRAVTVTDTAGEPVGVVVGAGHETDREGRDLAAGFPRLATDLPVVGLLHTQIETALGAAEHERYAPSVRADFERAGYAYWALGHVHQRQRALEDLPVWYAGNLQGRNPRETGPKGGLLVEAHAGAPADPTFVPFAPVRWERARLADLDELETTHALVERLGAELRRLAAAGPEELCARLELVGDSPLADRLHDEGERISLQGDLATATGALEVQIDASGLARPRDLAALRSTPSVLATALELCEGARRDDGLLERLAPAHLAGLEALRRRAAAEGDPGQRQAYLRSLLEGLEDELLGRCLETGE